MLVRPIELKDVTREGDVQAVVATLDVIDAHRDRTEKGFFGRQATKILQSHDPSSVLLGKGTVSDENGKQAVFEGRLNLEDPQAEQLHRKLRFDLENPPALIEWSYGFKVLDGGSRREGDVRVLQAKEDGSPGARIVEVSPVMVGAGVGTGTIGVKTGETKSILEELAELGDEEAAKLLELHAELDGKAEGERFIAQADRVAVALERLANRAGEISELRKDGRIGAESLDRLAEIRTVIRKLDGKLESLFVDGVASNSIVDEYLRFSRTLAS